MKNKTFNGQSSQSSAATSAITFKYSDGNFGLFNNWNELLYFWAPYYGGKAGADAHFRKYAYGVAVLNNKANNTEIMAAPVSGPLTASQKKDFITRASEYIINQ